MSGIVAVYQGAGGCGGVLEARQRRGPVAADSRECAIADHHMAASCPSMSDGSMPEQYDVAMRGSELNKMKLKLYKY